MEHACHQNLQDITDNVISKFDHANKLFFITADNKDYGFILFMEAMMKLKSFF